MKKIIFIICALFALGINGVYAAPKSNSATVSSVYNDVKDGLNGGVATVYNDAKAVVTTVYGDAKSVAETIYPDAKAAVSELAKALGVGAEYVWSVLVKQFVVKGIAELLVFVLGLLLLIAGIVWLARYLIKNAEVDWKIIPSIMLLLASIVILVDVEYVNMLQGIINPDFGAINYVLDFIKELK